MWFGDILFGVIIMSKKGKKDVIVANQPGLPGSTVGPISSIKKMKKIKNKEQRVRKRDKLKRLTHRQVEKLMTKAKKTWMSMNEVLKDGKWNETEDLKMMSYKECINCGADVPEDEWCAECEMCTECCECEK